MKTIMGIIGCIVISPIILAETLVKIVWGVLFYVFYPLWKCIFPVRFFKLEEYTHFKHEYVLVSKILELWDL